MKKYQVIESVQKLIEMDLNSKVNFHFTYLENHDLVFYCGVLCYAFADQAGPKNILARQMCQDRRALDRWCIAPNGAHGLSHLLCATCADGIA